MNRRRFVSQAGALSLLSTCKWTSALDNTRTTDRVTSDAKPKVQENKDSWTVGNGLIAKRLSWDGNDLRGVLLAPNSSVAPELGSSELYVFLAGRRWPGQDRMTLSKAHHESAADIASLHLSFTAKGSPLEVSMRYSSRKNDPAIEQVCIVRNTGDKRVNYLRRFDSCLLTIPLAKNTEAASMHWVEGLHDDEKLTEEPYPTYRVSARRLISGETVDFSSGRWSSNEKLPAMVVEIGDKTYYAGFGWSGQWNMLASHQGNSLTIQAGLADTSISLAPGESVESPASFYGVVHGESADAWNAIHDHCRAAMMPPVADDFPWVTYNTWYNFGIDLKEKALSEEAERAARLGVEVFYIDDGWFQGSATTGKWGMGAGNWVENRDKFPSGIASFAEHVHHLGMKFGLWVEPERLDAKFVGKSDMPAQSWLATIQDQPIRWGFTDSDNETPAYQVCFGDPRVRAWAIESLSRMIESYRLDWVKWDHNRYEVCQDWRHGHGSQDGDWAHTQGVWEVMSTLRRRFPDLILENCAAGGHRFDFGMMRHTHVTWTSDQTSPDYVSRRHVYGASHPFPPQYLTSWYIPERRDAGAGDLSAPRMDTLFRSHMLGAFGISDKLSLWTEAMTNSAKRSIDLYKRIRPYLRGRLAWLTPQPSILSPELQEAKGWEATQMYRQDKGESVIFVFRAASDSDSMIVRPRFIQQRSRYEIWDEDGYLNRQTLSAVALSQRGIPLHLAEKGTCALIYVRET